MPKLRPAITSHQSPITAGVEALNNSRRMHPEQRVILINTVMLKAIRRENLIATLAFIQQYQPVTPAALFEFMVKTFEPRLFMTLMQRVASDAAGRYVLVPVGEEQQP